ncbi:uncharacterized protein LOC9632130 [Selaginella moellendorffii]|uniref:uncharacterized protein LOC9632130 n=1 Tax=Selaginella moellendorffii TaxID=88036 RepID=UPI000D1CF323|nr:uncharacterized protein LOC9632130 [Selaginella moellendorffii]|eukprot:XP_024528027.1 uncharacterized protein LOC9632130 [Selaginella moellendorffii]
MILRLWCWHAHGALVLGARQRWRAPAAARLYCSCQADLSRVLEKADRAVERQEVLHTDFLTPPALQESLACVRKLADVGVVVSGGYAQAERCRLSLGPADLIRASQCSAGGYPGAVSALSVSGKFVHDAANHGDFLGAVLGTGIVREKVGDIIVLDCSQGAQILVVPELVEYLIASLKQVRTISVQCKEIPLAEIEIHKPRVKALKSVEASLRLDAVASAGFKLSRSKLADLISKGDVRLNWKEATKSNTSLKSGDVISLAGKGRLQIGEIETTKKGKFSVEMIRYE